MISPFQSTPALPRARPPLWNSRLPSAPWATGINSTESEMDFTDLGPAMAEAHTRDTAKSAEATAIALSQRVVALEARVAELSDRLDSIVDAINGRES